MIDSGLPGDFLQAISMRLPVAPPLRERLLPGGPGEDPG